MIRPTVKDIKRAQKESVLLRLISELFIQASLEDPELQGIFVSRVALSPDKGVCTVYFYTAEGKQAFEERLNRLKLYKPSLRKAIAHAIQARYTVELIFKFDEQVEKQHKIEKLIDSLKEKDEI
jgi:ribosome-binding factor A